MSLSRFEESLLASGANDGPSPERRRAARDAFMRAAGVAAVAGASSLSASTASAATAASTTSAAGASTVGAATAGTAKALTFAKIVFLAALGAGAAGAAVLASAPSSPSPAPRVDGTSLAQGPAGPAGATATAVAPASTELPPARAPTSPVAEESTEPASPAPPAASAGTKLASAPVAAASTSRNGAVAEDPLAVEARILEGARACLSAGDRACATARLAEHRARFARGVLVDEAALLAIDVALADGDRAEAERLARALVERSPRGAWSSRVRKLAEERDE